MRITNRQDFLVLRADPLSAKPKLRIVPALDTVVQQWTAGTRVSPIWVLAQSHGKGERTSEREAYSFNGKWTALFIGPHAIGDFFQRFDVTRAGGTFKAWATLGSFNLFVCWSDTAKGNALADEIVSWAKTDRVAIERWSIKGGNVDEVDINASTIGDPSSTLQSLSAIAQIKFPSSLNIHAQEFVALMASALARSAVSDPARFKNLQEITRSFAADMPDVVADQSQHLDLAAELITLNAGLSRYTSQAFSGTSPILSTECHFWIHSLLGTGTANMALSNLVDFVTRKFGKARLPDRFILLKELRKNPPTYEQLVTDDELMWRDHIGHILLDPKLDEREPLQPLVTYFSGRDGYSSQLQTLSAPISAIVQANSHQTNILTTTHEIAHVFVEGILGYLYPDTDDDDEIQALTDFVVENREPKNMFEAARKLLMEAILTIEQVSTGKDINNRGLTPANILAVLTKWRREAKEVMVHTFDYLHFFQDKPERYVEAIWSTWCAIPAISERIPEYVLRTLCAISPKLLKMKAHEGRAAARRTFEEALNSLMTDKERSWGYARKALDYIRHNWEVRPGDGASITQKYDCWQYLVRLVTMFMYSPRVVAEVFENKHALSRVRRGHFDAKPVGNPIEFVRGHLEKAPTEADSVWLLHNVAFSLKD